MIELYRNSNQLKSFKYSNLTTNGNFIGTTGWSVLNSSISSNINELTFLAIATNGQISSATINFENNSKYYMYSIVKASTNLFTFSVAGVISSSVSHSGSNDYEILDRLWTSTLNGNYSLRIRDSRTSGWDNVYIKNVFVVNLTSLYGAGNEPSAADCANIFRFVDGTTQPNFSKQIAT